MTSLLGEPEILLHDGGGEFTCLKLKVKRSLLTATHNKMESLRDGIKSWVRSAGYISALPNKK